LEKSAFLADLFGGKVKKEESSHKKKQTEEQQKQSQNQKQKQAKPASPQNKGGRP